MKLLCATILYFTFYNNLYYKSKFGLFSKIFRAN